MSTQVVQTKQNKSIFAVFGSGKAIWFVALGFAVAAMVGVMSLLSTATATTTYYVLSQPVPARSQITPSMLLPVTTSDGGQPGNAFGPDYLAAHPVFAKVALQRGDVVSPSNAGPATRLTDDMPSNFVAASFTVTADNAVGGKVRPGDFIDLIAQSDGDGSDRVAKIVLSRVYVLDVSVSADTLADNSRQVGGDEEAATEGDAEATQQQASPLQGIPALYTVGVSPKDAVKIAQIRDKEIFVVLSSIKAQGEVNVEVGVSDVFNGDAVRDSSGGIKLGTKGKTATDQQDEPAPEPTADDEPTDDATASEDATGDGETATDVEQ